MGFTSRGLLHFVALYRGAIDAGSTAAAFPPVGAACYHPLFFSSVVLIILRAVRHTVCIKQYVAATRDAGRLLSRFNGGKPYKREHKANEAVQCWLTDEVTRFLAGGNNVQEREQIARRGIRLLYRRRMEGRHEGGWRKERVVYWRRHEGYDRGAGGGGCSSKPIAMARPGVRQTLHSVSNNVNKRASILRFYRPVLSIFDNASRSLALAPLVAKPSRKGGARRVTYGRVGSERVAR